MFPVIPAAAEPLVRAIGVAFTKPTLRRFLVLMCGLIVTIGRRTVSHSLAALAPVLDGHWSSYHRLYSHARFSMWRLAAAMVRQVVALLPRDAVIELVADDTVDGKDGPRVWGYSAHRDPVRSSHGKTAVKFGHKWLVLCVLVQLPGWDRPWALPILCGLCISPKLGKRLHARQKTPSQLARRMLIWLMHQFPQRRFILIGDYQVVTHQTASFAQRHADQVMVIGRLRSDASFYAPPAHPNRRSRTGELPKKGRKVASPGVRLTQLKPAEQEVAWYGASRQIVRHVSERALWHDKHHASVTPIRWVCVLGDAKKDLHDAFFFCSDQTLEACRIIELFARRWNIEVTFQESRALLGLETTRHWCRQSVLRVTPILMGLFTAVVLIWQQLPKNKQSTLWSQTPCYTKTAITFADVLASVRRELWETMLMGHCKRERCLATLPKASRQLLLWHLSAAA